MKIKIFDRENTILNKYVAQMRDIEIQKNQQLFRFNLHRVAQIMAYEISRTFDYSTVNVVTPLGESVMSVPSSKVVVGSILRAGIPMHNGFLDFFEDAESAFVSAHREYHKDDSMRIVMQSVTTPSLEDKILILVDPMLATGASIEMAYHALVERGGVPLHTHFVALISSTDGLEYVQRMLPSDKVSVWTAALDSEMTVKSYIVPGIGDTGDLAYGAKL